MIIDYTKQLNCVVPGLELRYPFFKKEKGSAPQPLQRNGCGAEPFLSIQDKSPLARSAVAPLPTKAEGHFRADPILPSLEKAILQH